MKRFLFLVLGVLFFAFNILAQQERKIRFKVNGLKPGDKCQLAYHFGNKQYIKDSAIVDSKGWVTFEFKDKVEGGIYLFVTPSKNYFEFVMPENPNFTMETDTANFIKNMKVKNSPENQYFYEYLNYIVGKEKEAAPYRELLKNTKNNQDSIKMLKDKLASIDKEVSEYKKKFIKDHPDFFISKVFKAMQEPEAPEDPEMEKKDSLYKFKYFKNHYWDNVDFSDDRIVRTPIFHKKLEFYFENLVVKIPDSINAAADWLISKTNPKGDLFKYIVFYVTTTYERSKIMGMDAVFVHMVEKYYKTKMAYWVDSVQLYKIVDRAEVLAPLLIGKPAPELAMMDTSAIPKVDSLGMLNATSSEELTKLYIKNLPFLSRLFIRLYDIKAKYTILLFWDPDCGHCKKEVPKLHEEWKKMLQEGMDIKVYAVNTQSDYKEWKDFIVKHKLDWINVADLIHLNNIHRRYDIYSTPVIFLLDKDKKIIAKKLGAEQIKDFIVSYEKVEENKRKMNRN